MSPTVGQKLVIVSDTIAHNDRGEADVLSGKQYALEAGQIVEVLCVNTSAGNFRALVQDEHGSYAWVHADEVAPAESDPAYAWEAFKASLASAYDGSSFTRRVHLCGEEHADAFQVFAFGAYYNAYVAVGYVRNGYRSGRDLDEQLEIAAECLKDVAPGLFVEPDYAAAKGEILGESGAGDDMISDEAIAEHAEKDLTRTESGWLASWEWTMAGSYTREELLTFARNER